jgi:hypothetical protein
MFIDSEQNSSWSNMTQNDDGYMNHPGFIGGTWFKDLTQPKKAEEERYNEEKAKQKSNCDYAAGDSCEDLLDCKQYFQGLYNKNTGNTRVPKRIRKASSYHMGKVNEYLAARDCDVQTSVDSPVDTSYDAVDDKNEELAAIREQLNQISQDSATAQESTFKQAQDMINSEAAKSEQEKKNLMIGGGAVVAILLLVVLMK